MPKVCIERPNRTKARVYTAKDVGRIICYAIADGATIQEIRDAAEECMGEQEDCECDRLKQLIQNLNLLLEAVGLALSLLAGVKALRTILVKGRKALEAKGAAKEAKELDDFIEGDFKRIEEGGKAIPKLTEAVAKYRNELTLAERELFSKRVAGVIIREP